MLNKEATYLSGPGDAPAGFVQASTSYTEWMWYWASAKVYKDPDDPRMPPYWGGADWGYQLAQQGGRQQLMGAVVDFIYYMPAEVVGIRIQTARYHEEAGPRQHAFDTNQSERLSRFITVLDVYEQDFIADISGESACRLLVETLGGRKRIKPSAVGTYRRVRSRSI
jgi:hypothetical protein